MPSDEAAAWVIGMALPQALAHAAPDVPREKYAELGNRYRYHYLKRQDDVALFGGVLPMLQALRARGHLLAVATGKSRRGLDQCCRWCSCAACSTARARPTRRPASPIR